MERFAAPEWREWDQLAEHTVAEAMNRHVRSMPPDVVVSAAAELMAHAGIHRLLVLEGNELRGIVTTMDITRAVGDHRLDPRGLAFGRPRTPPGHRR